jgi:hypothetical protein
VIKMRKRRLVSNFSVISGQSFAEATTRVPRGNRITKFGRSFFAPILLKFSVSNFSRDDRTSIIHCQFNYLFRLFSMIYIEYFLFLFSPLFLCLHPGNDQRRDGQPVTTVEILEP